jgi:hypothetical protein
MRAKENRHSLDRGGDLLTDRERREHWLEGIPRLSGRYWRWHIRHGQSALRSVELMLPCRNLVEKARAPGLS